MVPLKRKDGSSSVIDGLTSFIWIWKWEISCSRNSILLCNAFLLCISFFIPTDFVLISALLAQNGQNWILTNLIIFLALSVLYIEQLRLDCWAMVGNLLQNLLISCVTSIGVVEEMAQFCIYLLNYAVFLNFVHISDPNYRTEQSSSNFVFNYPFLKHLCST